MDLKTCSVCKKRIPSRGFPYNSHMVAHVRAGEARIIGSGNEPVTLTQFKMRRVGDKFRFEPITPLLDAATEGVK